MEFEGYCGGCLRRRGLLHRVLQVFWAGSNIRRRRHAFQTISSSPVLRLSFQESANGTEVALVAEEIGVFFAIRPKPDSVGEGIHGLAVASDEGSSKIDVF